MTKFVKYSNAIPPEQAERGEELPIEETAKRMATALQRALETPASAHKKSRPESKKLQSAD